MNEIKENEKNTKGNKRKIIIVILLFIVLAIGTTYAWLTLRIEGNETNTIVAGTLSLVIENEDEFINISGAEAIPLTKETALKKENNIYTFELTNNGNIDSEYKIYLDIEDENEEETIPNNMIRYILTKNNYSRDDILLSESKKETEDERNNGKIILDSSSFDSESKALKPEETNTYSLRVWIDEEATSEIAKHTFIAKIRVVGTQTDTD